MGVLPQKISDLNGVKSCSSGQDKEEMPFHQTQGYKLNFCDDFEKRNVEKGWPFHTFELGYEQNFSNIYPILFTQICMSSFQIVGESLWMLHPIWSAAFVRANLRID